MELKITPAQRPAVEGKEVRVAAYCRVSTDSEDQWNSLESQKKFFQKEIQRNPNWVDCGIYADEGISGTTLDNRKEFKRMIDHAKAGNIDLIVTKEVSRFSRNIVDTLTIVDELARIGVYVYFMADCITTSNPEERERLDQLALYAQQESKRTSKRVRWGHQRNMERGVVFGRKNMYGYDIVRDTHRGPQRFEIIEEEAEIVRKIFQWYSEGDGTFVIAKRLEQMGVKSKYQNGWSNTVILRILRNEKYVGDLAQGKTYTPDPMSHKKKYNRGGSDFYYITDHHPESAIISRDLWNVVQQKLEENSPSEEAKAKHNNRYWLSGKVFCGVCGGKYISMTKKQKSDTYRAWACYANNHRGARKTIVNDLGESMEVGCDNKRVNERVLYQAVKELLQYLLKNDTEALIRDIMRLRQKIKDQKPNAKEIKKLEAKLEKARAREHKLLVMRMDDEITARQFKEQNELLNAEIESLQAELKELTSEDRIRDELLLLEQMEAEIKKYATISDDEFNEILFGRVTKRIVVYPEKILEFHFTFAPNPIRLQYSTSGRGDTYTATFTILENE
ncbi:MAG: recombinase family protein [Clostridia bacterium]|nr:recombinase family protein [Clostridia bacterium]